MIRAYHSIFSAYGFWLPNDPRGSWSVLVRNWELLQFGEATKVTTTRSVASKSHDAKLRRDAKKAMTNHPVRFTGLQARAIGRGFAQAVSESGYHILACAILPQHVHTVIARHDRKIERIIGHLKSRASQQLRKEGSHPFAIDANHEQEIPSPWGRKGWHVFLSSSADVTRAIRYVQDNPRGEGKPLQQWGFVKTSPV